MNTIDKLQNFKPKHDFFVGVDSDGCAFDAMGIKHIKAFIPMAIEVWGLEELECIVHEVEQFINLYSVNRGINRFPGLLLMFEYLKERADVKESGVALPDFSDLRSFVNSGMPMSNVALNKFAEGKKSKFLAELQLWSIGSDTLFSKHVENLPPFQYVDKSLYKISKFADTMVVSAASSEGLYKDWNNAGIAQYMKLIAGQDIGGKKEQLQLAAGDKYIGNHILMIGDAPGDLKAAKENNALFFPINPGHEVESWKLFYEIAFDRFINGTYEGEYEEELVKKFMSYLPEEKPWV
jgi:phosphoglycolate phosphatase-like HAD superfamily hydrolase